MDKSDEHSNRACDAMKPTCDLGDELVKNQSEHGNAGVSSEEDSQLCVLGDSVPPAAACDNDQQPPNAIGMPVPSASAPTFSPACEVVIDAILLDAQPDGFNYQGLQTFANYNSYQIHSKIC